MSKGCFVTVGATASFQSLVAAVLSVKFLTTLANARYTRLVVQFGKDGESNFSHHLKMAQEKFGNQVPLSVEGFAMDHGDFRERIASVVSGPDRGLLISHAGTGSLMDGLALKVPTILVPNPSLAENHQAELAEQFEKAGYCIHGDLSDLPSTVARAEELQAKGPAFTLAKASIWIILDQEMGFTDQYLD